MKTITFYSYKGGVGRTLALANLAKRLSEFSKTVCVIDFDLEAPGLHHKFEKELKSNFKFEKGLVDYISDFNDSGNIPEDFGSYVQTISFNSSLKKPIHLIPAGNVYESSYWRNLRRLDLRNLMLKNNREGILFFLDLKKRIESELKPDYLLIDSRTGITEIFGISISLLADRVVIVSANNEENYHGSKMIINTISNKENNFNEEALDLVFVISRYPFPKDEQETIKEKLLVKDTVRRINSRILHEENTVIIHSDRQLERNETLKIGYYYNAKDPTSNDYNRLFDILFERDIKDGEKESFRNDIAAHEIFEKAYNETSYETQIELYSEVIKMKPIFSEAFNNRAVAYANLQQIDLAILDYNSAIELLPEETLFHLNRGIAYSSQNVYDKALIDFNTVIQYDPKNVDALSNIAFIYSATEQTNLGIEFYKRVLEVNPNSENDIFCLSDLYVELGRYEDALQLQDKVLESNPVDTEALKNKAKIYHKKKELDKAIEFYSKALKIDPSDESTLIKMARVSIENKNVGSALSQLNKILAVNPKNGEALFSLGFYYGSVKQYKKAIEYYLKSIDVEPKIASTYYNVGIQYRRLKDKKNELKYFSKATEVDPKYYMAHIAVGNTYLAMEKYEFARKAYIRASKIDPSHFRAWYGLGRLYLLNNNLRLAFKYLSKANELEKNSTTLANLAHFFFAKMDVEKAIELYRSSWELISDKQKFQNYMKADFLIILKKYGITKKEFDKVLLKIKE